MQNLFNYGETSPAIKKNETIQYHHSFVFMSGIVKNGRVFDANGDIIDGRLILTPNFTSDVVSMFNEELVIKWDLSKPFDYYGFAVIKDEIVFIDTTATSGGFEAVGVNLIKIKNVKRGQYNTLKQEHFEGEVIRSVVNITNSTISYKFEDKVSLKNTLFDVVSSSGSIEIFDDVRRWIAYNEAGTFSVKQKTPIYVFAGLNGINTRVCTGFLTNIDTSFAQSSIEIDFSSKMSLFWDEDIKFSKTFVNQDIKTVISETLGINKNNIKFPNFIREDGTIVDEYILSDFFKCDVIATKEFKTYQEFLTAIAKELMIRMYFDGDELIIQSELLKTLIDKKNSVTILSKNNGYIEVEKDYYDRIMFYNETTNFITATSTDLTTDFASKSYADIIIYNNRYFLKETIQYLNTNSQTEIKNAIKITEYDNMITFTDKSSDDLIFNKIEGEFITRIPYYNPDEFKWTTKEFANIDEFHSWQDKESFDIAIIRDTNTFWRKEAVNHGDFIFESPKPYSNTLADLDDKSKYVIIGLNAYEKRTSFELSKSKNCSVGFVKKGNISDYQKIYGFVKPIKYKFKVENVLCDTKNNSNALIYNNINGDSYFNTVTVVVGENAQFLNIGEPYQYVMLTDGKRDFTGTVADIIIDSSNPANNKASFIFGFDRDSNNYERGFIEYNLLPEGYGQQDKKYVLYYGRIDMLYSYEYKWNDTTFCMNKPLIAGETFSFEGNYGGVDNGVDKFSGIVGGLDNIYDTVLTNTDLMYNREYHQIVPIYIKTNTVKADSVKNFLDYDKFNNSNMALQILKNNKVYKDTINLYGDEGAKTFASIDDSNADMYAKLTNLKYGFKITLLSNVVVDGDILPYKAVDDSLIKYTTIDFTEDEIKAGKISSYYKIEANSKAYLVEKELCKRYYSEEDLNFIPRTQIISVDAGSILLSLDLVTTYGIKIGDLVKLSQTNEDIIETKFNYNRYSDNDFFVLAIEQESQDTARVYFQYEMPVGLLNTFMDLVIHKAEDVLVFQEFAIRGNPYYEKKMTINYENEESIAYYGERKYEGLTGKFLKLDDLRKVVNYIIEGFSGLSKDSIKKVFSIETNLMFDVEPLDFIQLDERVYTGMEGQYAVVLSKTTELSNLAMKHTLTCMTIDDFELKQNTLLQTINNNYEPLTLPVFKHNTSSTGTTTNLIDVQDVHVSQFDERLGSVSLVKIAEGNLIANNKFLYDETTKRITLYNFKPTTITDTTIVGYTEEQIREAKASNASKNVYTDSIFQFDKPVFVSIGNEFLYVKTISINKTDGISGHEQVVDTVELEVLQRQVFNTEKNSTIPVDQTVRLYIVSNMSNKDGFYTLSTTIGNTASRDYFSFDIKNGIAVQTQRGKILIATEEDFIESIKLKHNTSLLDLESLGKGLFQIGDSTGSQYIRYTPTYGVEFSGNADIQSGSIKLNIGNNNEILQRNFMRLDNAYSILGFNVPTSIGTVPANATSLLQFGTELDKSHFIYKVQNGVSTTRLRTDYLTVELDENNKMYMSYQPSPSNLNELKLSNNSNFVVGDTTSKNYINAKFVDSGENFVKIASQDIKLESANNIIKLDNTIGKIEFLGNSSLNLSNVLVFNKTGATSTLTVKPNILDIKSGSVNELYFDSNASNVSKFKMSGEVNFILGDATTGLAFSKIGSTSTFSLKSKDMIIGDIANGNYIKIDTTDTVKANNTARLYFNDGMQQIGTSVGFGSNTWNGFYFGDTNIANGKYIKYSYAPAGGSRLSLGQKTELYQGEAPIIAMDSLVSEAYDTLNSGSTVTTGNTMKIYASGRFARLRLSSDQTKKLSYVSTTGAAFSSLPITSFYTSSGAISKTTVLNFDEVSPIALNFSFDSSVSTNLAKLIGFSMRFVNSANSADNFELKIIGLDSTNVNFASYGAPTANAVYEIQFEKIQNAYALIGDLTTTESIDPRIILGWRKSGSNEDVVFKVGTTDDYISFSSLSTGGLNGIQLKSTTGKISIGNTTNSIVLNGTTGGSLISLNSGLQQFGRLTGLTVAGLSNGYDGLFIGDSVSNPSKYFYASQTDIKIKTSSFQVETASADSYLNFNDGLIQFGKLTIGASNVNTPYGLYIGNNATKSSATNYLYADGSTVDIKATTLNISAGNAVVDLNTSNSSIKMTNLKLGYINESLGVNLISKSGLYIGNTTNYISYNSTDGVFNANVKTSTSATNTDYLTIGNFTHNSSTYNGLKIGSSTNYLAFGATGSSNLFAIKMASGVMDLSASTMNFTSASALNLTSGTLTIGASGKIDLIGGQINLTSSGSLNLASGSNVNISSTNFNLTASGNIILSNTKNKIELKTDNTSRILLNQSNLGGVSTNIIFALSDKLSYNSSTNKLSIAGDVELTITNSHLADGTINGGKLLANSITADKINVNNLIANKLTASIIQSDDKSFSVVNGKLTAKSLYGSNFALGEKILTNNTQDGLSLTGSNFNLIANTTTGEFSLISSGDTDLKNDKNRIYLDKLGVNSQIILNSDWKNEDGSIKSEYQGVEFQIGDEDVNGDMFRYDSNGSGLRIVAEDPDKLQKVILSSRGFEVLKRNSINEAYAVYDRTILSASGEIECRKGWSSDLDLKSFNGGRRWSNLNMIKMIGNLYSTGDGIPNSQLIQHEFVGDPSNQIVRFRVYGSTTLSKVLSTSSFGIYHNVKQISLSGTIRSFEVHIGYYTGALTKIKIIVNGITVYDASSPKNYNTVSWQYSSTFTSLSTVEIRKEGEYGRPGVGTVSGTRTEQTINGTVYYDASVNWLAIGNS